MNLNNLLTSIDAEISILQQARKLLVGDSTDVNTSLSNSVKAKRNLSPEARARIVAAQKKRWAKAKRAAKKASE